MTPPAFNIEAEVVVKSDGAKTMAWIVIIFCDILLFTYRMVAASNTAYRYDCMAEICNTESELKIIETLFLFFCPLTMT